MAAFSVTGDKNWGSDLCLKAEGYLLSFSVIFNFFCFAFTKKLNFGVLLVVVC